jgi:hypothetical protein
MGWGSGSSLAFDVIKGLSECHATVEQRKMFYGVLIPAMENQDWDTHQDSMGIDPAFDEVVWDLHPDW